MKIRNSNDNGFTLIELLIVIGIVAVLATVVVIAINPSEMIKQARDSTRLSDLGTINKALGVYQMEKTSLGSSSVVYVSIPDSSSACANLGLPTLPSGWSYACVSSSTLTKNNGLGWIPVDFTSLSYGYPIEKLPIDPINTTSSGDYYTYVPGGSWELTAILESEKYQSKARNDGGDTAYVFEQGNNLTLSPSRSCGPMIAYAGQNYATVAIGSQCWMAGNLNVGTMLCAGEGTTCATEQSNNSVLEKYCYQNNTAYCATYGGLYQWAEAMNLAYVCNADNGCAGQIGSPHQGICPTGWHIPTDAEYKTLEVFLGMCTGAGAGCVDATGWRGTNEGSKLAGNAALWSNGTLDANANFGVSGLGVLPAGYRYTSGSFYTLSYFTNLWSSLQSGGSAWRRHLYSTVAGVYRYTDNKLYGFSVRCLKD